MNIVKNPLAWNVSSIRPQSLLVCREALVQGTTLRSTLLFHSELGTIFLHEVVAITTLNSREVSNPPVINNHVFFLGIRREHGMDRKRLSFSS
jgi:hypothetical protein